MKSDFLEYKNYLGSIEPSLKDRCLHGKIQFIKDVISYEGQTINEIESAFRAAVDDYLVFCESVGDKPDVPFSGTFNVRVGEDLHRTAAVFATKQQMSLNEVIKQALERFVCPPEQAIANVTYLVMPNLLEVLYPSQGHGTTSGRLTQGWAANLGRLDTPGLKYKRSGAKYVASPLNS